METTTLTLQKSVGSSLDSLILLMSVQPLHHGIAFPICGKLSVENAKFKAYAIFSQVEMVYSCIGLLVLK